MKIIQTFIIINVLFTLNANSQITKGNWLVGGSGSYKSTSSKTILTGNKDKYVYLEVAPNVGYFFADKIAGGIKTSFYYNPYEGAYNIGFGIGPFLKYYFLKPEKLVNVFVQANYLYYENNNYSEGIGADRFASNTYGLKAGPVIYFNESVALELGLEFNRDNRNNTLIDDTFQISIGFQIHLTKI
jgi:hypothetical protein